MFLDRMVQQKKPLVEMFFPLEVMMMEGWFAGEFMTETRQEKTHRSTGFSRSSVTLSSAAANRTNV